MREFGRTPGACVCNVLAILSDGEDSIRSTIDAAVELAQETRARLTLVKTCDSGRAYVWVAPFAVGAAYLPPELESPDEAARVLAHLAEQVPASIPLTTMVLSSDAQAAVLRLLRERHFGAIVADKDQLARWRAVRRQLERNQARMVLIRPGLPPVTTDQFPRLIRTRRNAEVSTSESAASRRSRSTGSSSYLRRVRPRPAR